MDFEKLLDYQFWATSKIISCLKGFSESEMTQDLGNLFVNDLNKGHGCIRSIIEHIISSLNFCFNYGKSKILTPDVLFIALDEKYRQLTSHQLLDLWEKLNITYKEEIHKSYGNKFNENNLEMVFNEEFCYMFINHETYHRGQLMIAIKMVGKKGINTDFGAFCNNKFWTVSE